MNNKDSKPYIIITGASGGIGQAFVKIFAQAGYSVIATDIVDAPDNLPCYHFIQADLQRTVQDEVYAQYIFTQVKACLNDNGLKGLINNAAVQILGNFDILTRSDWYNTLEVNLLAPVIWTQAFLPELEQTQGSVLNISSIHAKLTKKNFAAYATSKAALSGLTRSMAIELGNKIRINAIEPAAIDTPMLRAGFADNREGFEQLKSYHPSQTIGTPEELGKLALFIVENESLFFNGAIVSFDGGIGSCLHDPN
jgi:NAD(P)-dependent dehydrogenase (short-subunit alcohol dehydrogenase family)